LGASHAASVEKTVSSRGVTFAGYAVIATALVVWQVASVVRHSLTLAQLVRWLTRGLLGRVLFLLGWAWLGWHLFSRGNAKFLR